MVFDMHIAPETSRKKRGCCPVGIRGCFMFKKCERCAHKSYNIFHICCGSHIFIYTHIRVHVHVSAFHVKGNFKHIVRKYQNGFFVMSCSKFFC